MLILQSENRGISNGFRASKTPENIHAVYQRRKYQMYMYLHLQNYVCYTIETGNHFSF